MDMKPDINISDQDVKRVLKKLDRYSAKTQLKIEKQVTQSAFNIHGDAARNCPVKTGRLRSSLHVKTQKNEGHNYSDNKGKSFSGTLLVKVKKGEAIVGTNVEYAQPVEERKPYLFPAAEKERANFNSQIRKILRERP